jgi:hypothetical protein
MPKLSAQCIYQEVPSGQWTRSYPVRLGVSTVDQYMINSVIENLEKMNSPLLARLRRPLHKILSLAKLAFFQLKSDRKVNGP